MAKKQFMDTSMFKTFEVPEGVNPYTMLVCDDCGMEYLDTPNNKLVHQPLHHEVGVTEDGRYIPIASTDYRNYLKKELVKAKREEKGTI